MEQLLLEYADRFNENFPLYLLKGKSEQEVEKIIKKSLELDTPVTTYVQENEEY